MKYVLAALALMATAGAADAQRWHRGYGHWHGGWGGGLGAAVTGAIIGGAIGRATAPQYAPPVQYAPEGPPTADEIAYCARRFRSYDARTGTYLGYDGQTYRCP